MKLLIAGIGLVLACGSTFAHHARVYFSDEVIDIEGELTSLTWRNPHPLMKVTVTDSSGAKTEWQIEVASAVYNLQRQGVTGELFEVGQTIKVAGQVSTRAANELLGTNVLLPDATEVLLRSNRLASPYFSTASVVGGWQLDHLEPVNAAEESLGIFRVWSPPGGRVSTEHSLFTEAALEARSAWDPTDNFIMRCETPGMPFAMKTPHPYEFIDNGDEILLRSETWDIERTIDMSGESGDIAPSPLGYSVGRWEDNTLVVHTTQIDWPYFDQIGTPQSDDVEMEERFILSDDQTRLDYRLVVEDPVNLTEPSIYESYSLALGDSLPTYDCQVN